MKLFLSIVFVLAATSFQATAHAQRVVDLTTGPGSTQLLAPATTPDEVATGDNFHRGIVAAVRKQVRAGKINRRTALRIRVAMISPAIRAHAEDLAVLQMSASGGEVPVDADGRINRAGIDWDSLSAFLEAFLPVLLKLLDLFGA